jgi:hypothetical protein
MRVAEAKRIRERLMIWATLNPANIKLSVLRPSIQNLPREYSAR